MKKLLSILLTVFLAALSSNLYAECQDHSCYKVYVDKLVVHGSVVYVGTSGDETLLNCEPHGGQYATLDTSKPNADKIYSTLLSAQIADKKVRVRIGEETIGCNIAYITIERQ